MQNFFFFSCELKVFSGLRVILSVLSGVYNMGGSPLPTVAKIKNLVYMNPVIDEETGVNPREEYLGKSVCHHSAESPVDKQQFAFAFNTFV